MYLFIVWSQIGSSRRMETILFTVFPKHMELWMAHGGGPMGICFAVIEYLCLIRPLLLFRVQIYSLCYKSESSPGKLTCTFISKACFLCLGSIGAQRREFTSHWDVSDLISWKLYIGFPQRNRFSFSFCFWEEKRQTWFLLTRARRVIFMNLYHMSAQTLAFLSLRERIWAIFTRVLSMQRALSGKVIFWSSLSHKEVQFFLWLVASLTLEWR